MTKALSFYGKIRYYPQWRKTDLEEINTFNTAALIMVTVICIFSVVKRPPSTPEDAEHVEQEFVAHAITSYTPVTRTSSRSPSQQRLLLLRAASFLFKNLVNRGKVFAEPQLGPKEILVVSIHKIPDHKEVAATLVDLFVKILAIDANYAYADVLFTALKNTTPERRAVILEALKTFGVCTPNFIPEPDNLGPETKASLEHLCELAAEYYRKSEGGDEEDS